MHVLFTNGTEAICFSLQDKKSSKWRIYPVSRRIKLTTANVNNIPNIQMQQKEVAGLISPGVRSVISWIQPCHDHIISILPDVARYLIINSSACPCFWQWQCKIIKTGTVARELPSDVVVAILSIGKDVAECHNMRTNVWLGGREADLITWNYW